MLWTFQRGLEKGRRGNLKLRGPFAVPSGLCLSSIIGAGNWIRFYVNGPRVSYDPGGNRVLQYCDLDGSSSAGGAFINPMPSSNCLPFPFLKCFFYSLSTFVYVPRSLPQNRETVSADEAVGEQGSGISVISQAYAKLWNIFWPWGHIGLMPTHNSEQSARTTIELLEY